MGQVVDKRSADKKKLKVNDKSGRGKGNSAKVIGDPDWSLNQDWDSTDFDLSPKNS